MAEDWLADVRKYVADADEAVVKAIIRYCGIALQNRDSSMVSFSDKKETDRVRENFLKKKLGLTDSDDVLDAAIAAVGTIMREDRTKNRVTVYYLLARHFGMLDLFGKAAGPAAGSAAALGAAGLAAAAVTDGDEDEEKTETGVPLAAVGVGAAAAGVGTSAVPPAEPFATMTDPVPDPDPDPGDSSAPAYMAASYGDGDDATGGGLGWLKWLLLALLLALLLFFLMRSCSADRATPAPEAMTSDASSGATAETDGADAKAGAQNGTTSGAATPVTTAAADRAGATAAASIPQGAGVVQGEIGGRPKLTVYFDSGKSAVSNDLATAASKLKAYMAKNPGARIAVSGYNDPSGNAAANAALSKKRAQEVAKALERVGIAATAINLEKPMSATDTNASAAEARRVEVVVKP